MPSYKQKKISTIVREITIVNGQSKYDIAGIDIDKSKFFYRYSQEQFKDLNVGDYTLDKSSNTQTIEITNSEILRLAEAIQICYVVDLTSSRYEVDFDVDINRLSESHNKLVDDVHVLWEYVKKTAMIADDTTIDLILPQLNTDEVWVKTDDGYKGISLTDAEGEIKKVIDEYTKLMEQRLDAYVENPLKIRLDQHVERVNKPELDLHVEVVNKPELDDYTAKLEQQLQDMIDQAVSDKGQIPRGTDWFEMELGNWYVTDLFNMNYTHYPPMLKPEDKDGVVKKDITDNSRSQILRYWTTTRKLFFTVRVNEVWSEWQVLGDNTNTLKFHQPNHGFIFTPITLDGNTRQWVKATKYTGADAIAIRVDNDNFNIITKGYIDIPINAKDDKGNAFIYDEYYFLSQEVDGGFSKDKNYTGVFQNLIHIEEQNGRLVSYVDVQDPINLDYNVLDTETADRIGIGTYDTTLRKVNTIAVLKATDLKVGEVVEVLGYYTKSDGATHKRVIASDDDGSGVQLSNGLWANIVHNGEINIKWLGCKAQDESSSLLNYNIILKSINTNLKLFIDNVYYITQNGDNAITSDSIVLIGDGKNGKIISLNNDHLNVFKITTNKKVINLDKIIIENSLQEKQFSTFFRIDEPLKIETINITKCKFISNNLSVFIRWLLQDGYVPKTTNEEGIKVINISDNYFKDVDFEFITIVDIIFDYVKIKNNMIENFRGVLFKFSINNSQINALEISKKRKKVEITNNIATNSDDNIYNPVILDNYYCLALFEADYGEYIGNNVSGMKCTDPKTMICDVYFGGDLFIYKNNIWKNNISLVENQKDLQLFQVKHCKEKYCINNTFIIEKDFLDKHNVPESARWVRLSQHTHSDGGDKFIFSNNIINVVEIKMGSTSEYANFINDVIFCNNIINSEKFSEGVLFIPIKNTNFKKYICLNNVFNLGEYTETQRLIYSNIDGTDSNTFTKYDFITIENNIINIKSSSKQDFRLCYEGLSSKKCSIRNNTINNIMGYSAPFYNDIYADEFLFVDNIFNSAYNDTYHILPATVGNSTISYCMNESGSISHLSYIMFPIENNFCKHYLKFDILDNNFTKSTKEIVYTVGVSNGKKYIVHKNSLGNSTKTVIENEEETTYVNIYPENETEFYLTMRISKEIKNLVCKELAYKKLKVNYETYKGVGVVE